MSFLDALISPVTKLAGKFIKDKDQLEKFKHEFKMTIHKSDIAQMEVNKVEAAHKSLFVAGWRPFIGWVCGVGLLYSVMLRDLIVWVMALIDPTLSPPPDQDTTQMTTVLMGMLGMGGLRTFEKIKKVHRDK